MRETSSMAIPEDKGEEKKKENVSLDDQLNAKKNVMEVAKEILDVTREGKEKEDLEKERKEETKKKIYRNLRIRKTKIKLV